MCAMAQYTLKIKTYDPGIVCAFERLRKSRKQSAYTHEALKYFLASEQGARVMELMVHETSPVPTMPEKTEGLQRDVPPQEPLVQPERPGYSTDNIGEDYCASVLGKILD
ncbi:conserved hypothetical protein [Pelobacter propionicus DSM 2379]|uniref:Uncharacterized protein n=2 Tax=Pelobacter propionicus TaxID=29543 RepID=A1AKN0_PELPD|nr:conserved hypothetical protein [Pelobacter propionicus DSM 2379]